MVELDPKDNNKDHNQNDNNIDVKEPLIDE